MSGVLVREDVEVIYARLKDGDRATAIARDFMVSQQTISAIKHGQIWGHVTGLGEPLDPRRRITQAKLTESDVLDIDHRMKQGVAVKALAAEYGVSIHSIYSIRYGETWNWLTGNRKESK